MPRATIVATTPSLIGKAYQRAFNDASCPELTSNVGAANQFEVAR